MSSVLILIASRSWKLCLGFIFAVVMFQAELGIHRQISIASGPIEPVEAAMEKVSGHEEKGFMFRLSEADGSDPGVPPDPPASAVRLGEAATRSVFVRLPELKPEESDVREFAIREESLPPPRMGKTVKEPFPPSEESPLPDIAPEGPLQILRFAPEGEVPLAPHLSVTFSHPMVPIAALADLGHQVRPLTLTPEPTGRWRWVGTSTLLFEPEDRFPMATDYQVEVSEGVTSAAGAMLQTPVRWGFSTPPAQLKSWYPDAGPTRLDPLIFMSFDQRIQPEAVLSNIRLRAGGEMIPVALADIEQISVHPEVKRLVDSALDETWLLLRPERRLPAGERIVVEVGSGAPSAEGPKKTGIIQQFEFHTYGPLLVSESGCGWREFFAQKCSPLSPFHIRFNNPLDERSFSADMVSVTPDLPGLKTTINGKVLTIHGRSKGRTTYKVTLKQSIGDRFGQTLGRDETVSFKVGNAPRKFEIEGGPVVVLDPAGRPELPVYTINQRSLNIQLYAVSPEDWTGFQRYLERFHGLAADTPILPPGEKILSLTIPIKGRADELTETRIDLSAALREGVGQVVAVIEPTGKGEFIPELLGEHGGKGRAVWVQATRIGLDAFVDGTDLLAWATSLADGRPLEGVELTLLPSGEKVITPANGLALMKLPTASNDMLVARHGVDVAILPKWTGFYWADRSSEWTRLTPSDMIRWFVFDDRKMYRPGEEVKIKGWVRRFENRKGGDIGALEPATTFRYTLKDSRGNEINHGSQPLNAMGGFDFSLKLPANMNLGRAYLEFSPSATDMADYAHRHFFQVQEFRRPEFEVSTTATKDPHFLGGSAEVTVTASYYAGGGLPDAEATWNVSSYAGSYVPPNRSDFNFGSWFPWWDYRPHSRSSERSQSYSGRTDPMGRHRIKIAFESVHPPRASNVNVEATVMDVNRQAWTAETTLLVHPADLYVGVRSARPFVRQGEPIHIDTIVTDLEGYARSGKTVKVSAARMEWNRVDGGWREEPFDVLECAVTSSHDPVRCTFNPTAGGRYHIIAIVSDDQGRPNESEISVWVAGGKALPVRTLEQEKVTLIPDRLGYQAGDVAEVLVLAPFSPAEGVLTLRRSGIEHAERFAMSGASVVLKVPIKESYTPNIHAQVNLNGQALRLDSDGEPDPELPLRPAYAKGTINLKVPPRQRTLGLTVTPQKSELEPGGETVLDIALKDAHGVPVAGGELAVVVVDEAVLSLTGYRLPDPLNLFYALRDPGVKDHHLRAMVLLSDPGEMVKDLDLDIDMDLEVSKLAAGPPRPIFLRARLSAPAPSEKRGGETPIRVRSDFSALAVFAPSVPTDAMGRAQVKVKLPDSLTRYRVMVVAAAGDRQFGSGESTITARLPLMLRPSPPRFLNFGDEFELPVVVQNQTGEKLEIDVAVRAANAALPDGMGRRVSVPAHDRVEVRFPVKADSPGTARFQAGAVAGPWADASEWSLPVWTPATTEAFATYGHIDEGAVVQPVSAPSDVVTQFGGLEVTTSSTALQALTDALLYLVSYPFECAEQLASRVMGIVALRDVLAAFKADGLPSSEELIHAVERDIKKLQMLQGNDGGFPFWRRGGEAWPYVSIHAAHALSRAKAKGFEVPVDRVERSLDYLKNIEKKFPSWYSKDVRWVLTAYALHVRAHLGDPDPASARKLIYEAGLEKLPLEAVGWLLTVLSPDKASSSETAAIRKLLANRVSETAEAAHFVTSYEDGAHLLLHSNRRADGIVLEALIGDQPQNDLIPKLVNSLLAHRKAGRWLNTQENVFILTALDRYFNTYEKITPDFVARAWLGEAYAGDHAYKGHTAERHHLEIPMSYLAGHTDNTDLTLSKEGPGRLYYRISMRYAPTSLILPPEDSGFTVERIYQPLDDEKDVRLDKDGVWHVRAGARVRVRLTMVAPSRRYHVALVDPLPAGFEPINPALAVTGSVPQGPASDVEVLGAPGLGGPGVYGKWWWWSRPWFEHQNLRDERVEAFASLLWEGVYTYTYVARATTPGRFVVPPPKAEEMYHPETFGRGRGDRVVIE
jgi:alpha-2-macroglobulin